MIQILIINEETGDKTQPLRLTTSELKALLSRSGGATNELNPEDTWRFCDSCGSMTQILNEIGFCPDCEQQCAAALGI